MHHLGLGGYGDHLQDAALLLLFLAAASQAEAGSVLLHSVKRLGAIPRRISCQRTSLPPFTFSLTFVPSNAPPSCRYYLLVVV